MPSKNMRRWMLGVLHPRGAAESASEERSSAWVECVARAPEGARLTVGVRFLQLDPASSRPSAEGVVPSLERRIDPEPIVLFKGAGWPASTGFCFPGIDGLLRVSAEPLSGGLFRVAAQLANLSAVGSAPLASAFHSGEILLALEEGEFVPADERTTERLEAAV